MAPNTAKDWITVADERAADAEAMLPSREDSAGPIYMAGYAIECSLKAYLQSRGTRFPAHGAGGHDLRELWRSSKFKLRELNDQIGNKTFFIHSWSTDLRYEQGFEHSLSSKELVKGAKTLSNWIQQQIRRRKRRKR